MTPIHRRTATALFLAAVLLLAVPPAAAAPAADGSVVELPVLSNLWDWLAGLLPTAVPGASQTSSEDDPTATSTTPDDPLLDTDTTTQTPEPDGETFPMGDPNG